jgi:cellulose synthase/poly-beta-1,6-N-acetylglucosamine synthase-like glycosyltransferase
LSLLFSIIVVTEQALLLSAALYYLLISLGGLWWFPGGRRKAALPLGAYLPRFLCLTMAYNEEAVIGEHVRNLLELDYPKQYFHAAVVADNCTDRTARVAASVGADVWQRTDPGHRGKGQALKWALYDHADLSEYEAVCVFDADNLVDPNFLREMASQLQQGNEVVQAYLDTKNPRDSWVSASYASAYWFMNRFWQRARIRLGLSGALGGTGFCIASRVLQSLPWDTASLTEDLEYSTQIVLRGERVFWTPHTRVYDEKPITLTQSFRQRNRWLRGHWSTAFRYSPRMVRALLHGSIGARLRVLDFLIYLWQPLVILLTGLNLLTVPIQLANPHWYHPWLAEVLPAPIWFSIVGVGLIMPLLAFALEDADWSSFFYYPAFLLFNLTWIPVAVVGLLRHRDRSWSHTSHTRSVSYEELETVGEEP